MKRIITFVVVCFMVDWFIQYQIDRSRKYARIEFEKKKDEFVRS